MSLVLLPPQNFVKTTAPTIFLTENYNEYQDKLMHSGMLFIVSWKPDNYKSGGYYVLSTTSIWVNKTQLVNTGQYKENE
jgi:hypothetical protein